MLFRGLFSGNIKLTDARNLLLPATTLKEGCYQSMFQGCARLTETPVLPAEELVNGCYDSMFSGCSSLSSVTCLATSGINEDFSTRNWLSGVAAEGTFTKAASANVGSGEYGKYWPTNSPDGIPRNWRVEEAEMIFEILKLGMALIAVRNVPPSGK